MKPASPALIAMLNAQIAGTTLGGGFSSGFSSGFGGTQMIMCDFDLYTITTQTGLVLRFTTADFDINCGTGTNFGGLTNPVGIYSSGGVRVDQMSSKTQAHWKIGLDSDQWTVVVMPRAIDIVTGTVFPDVIGNVPWLAAAMAGALDAADVQIDRAYFYRMPTWPIPVGGATPVGTITIFAGLMAEVDTTNSVAVLTINDYRSLLSYNMPRHYFQGMCRHQVYDNGCDANGNMNRASYAVSATAKSTSTQSSIVASAPLTFPANSSNTFTLGQIQFTSGLNAGFWGFVVSWDGGVSLSLLVPMPFAVAAGDAFTVYPGCDKTAATCALFNNTPQFGGEPYIPVPETLTSG
jgi:Phage conserved hypothetical protein BR0599/Uncharacterized conserved protein (DUF2163)